MLESLVAAVKILGVIAIFCGIPSGAIGIFLRNKYENHPNENRIVMCGMLIASFVSLFIFFLVIGVFK